MCKTGNMSPSIIFDCQVDFGSHIKKDPLQTIRESFLLFLLREVDSVLNGI